MTVNRHRGDVEIELEGKTYLMRPTVEGLVQIEASTGRSIMDLLRRFAERRFGFSDMTAVVTAGLRGAGTEVNDRRVAEMVFNSGYQTCVVPAAALLACIWMGNLTEDDEAGLAATANQEGEHTALGESSRAGG